MPEDFDSLRAELAAQLPGRIRQALESYDRFSADEPPADAKGFAAWQAAAKAALGHVEVLVKLARWASGQGESAAAADDPVAGLLAEARAALDGFDDEDEDET
ncbi:hypothetical protein [Magnetospirillum sp. UT-4]|uniref:hypothetical protein n=1 Tax=Magnetospirillum sp. UT-4 TaxID=2681467 RepID=UPI001383323D|nr:hypothetical protein [Magnetospirillum sp. UT-4]CAA7617662.1 conserved hypothetical protein [Magnetospirillum sp. UT-4]